MGLALYFIYDKVNNQKNLYAFTSLLQDLNTSTICITVSVVVLMMFANWFLEVVKWKYLARSLEDLSWWKATKSVFCGLTWAIFTPNRIGEYGGRIMLLQADNRAKGAVLMGVGLFAQLVLTSVFGALSIAWFVSTFFEIEKWLEIGVWVVAILYAAAFIVMYLNVQFVEKLVSRIKFLKSVKPYFASLHEVSKSDLLWVLTLSLARFTIFTSQYIVLMWVILPEISMLPMIFMIFILFFVQSAVPSLDIFDFSVRSFVASNLYSYITTQEIAVMAIVSFIWFVNLILPALIGSIFVLNVNYLSDNNS